MAPTVTTTNRQKLNPIKPEDRIALQTEARAAVSTLADDIAKTPTARPSAQTVADSRRAIGYDPATQQIYARAHGQVPTATNENGTVTITGSAEADRIRIEQNEDQIRAYYTDANNEEQLLDEWNSADVERVEVDGGEGDDVVIGENLDGRFTLKGGAGDDEIANKGDAQETDIESATLDGGEGDDLLVNTRTGATLQGGAGANELVNSGDLAAIGGEGADIDSEDAVFNAGNQVTVNYENDGAHSIQSIGNDNTIATAGEGGTINVAGDFNTVVVSGQGNDITAQGDLNTVVGTTGGNSVQVAGTLNELDLVGTGNTVDINGDANFLVTDNAAGILLDNFDQLDADDDGVLLPEEIAQVPGAEEIAQHADALMFATIQEGSNAWHGLSREDLETVANRMYGGETLEDISQDLMESSWLGQRIAQGGREVTPEAFAEEVNRYRQSNPRPDVDGLSLAPLLDINQIGVWGDSNMVATPGPGTFMVYNGSDNELAVGGNSAVAGAGDDNTINMGGPNSVLGFQGSGNQIASGGGNTIVGSGDYNFIDSYGWDLIGLSGMNFINGQLDPRWLQMALAPYFAEMGLGMGMDQELLIQTILMQGRGRVA